MSQIILNANAKINLFLDIKSRRDDGYHNIISIMQSINLHDTLHIEYEKSSKKEISVSCSNANIPQDSSNIAYRAADMMLDSGKVKINIIKRIPSPSGLAGGSADAGATVYGLSQLLGIKYDVQLLKAIGADVPFCAVGGSRLVSGIGDELQILPDMTDCYIVVACKGEGMSTPCAYKLLDDRFDSFKSYKFREEILNKIILGLNQGAVPDTLFNIFENDISKVRPDVTLIKEYMLAGGALCAGMSGSGPSVFGIFKNRDKAENTQKQLLDIGAIAKICTPCKSGTSIVDVKE